MEAGAQAILTQPPQLDWARFERWYADADRRGLLAATTLVLGAPMLSSAGNVAFWMALCGLGGSHLAGGNELMRQFSAAEARGKAAAREWATEYNARSVQQVRVRRARGGELCERPGAV